MRSNKRTIKHHYELKESSYYNKLFTILSISLFSLTLLSTLILSSPSVLADNSATNTVRVTVPISCNLSSSTTTAHTTTIDAGTYRNDIGESTITATCNDSGGFAIYAIGYSSNTHGNNTLINTTNENQTIASGTATSGATSNWAMKLTAVTGTYEPTIESTFESYTTIPTTYTKVASLNSTTDQSTGANFKSTYAAYIAPTQYAGTYEGKVKYTLVHPSTHIAPIVPAFLDTGQNVNAKMKSIAANSTKTCSSSDYFIKSIQTADSLPADFEPSEANTISLATSENPVYIFFDNENDAGTMYVYSGAATPIMNPDSSYLFYGAWSLYNFSAISSWDTSSVTDMSWMFQNAGGSPATTFYLDLSSWNTSNVTNMSGMFRNFGSDTSIETFSLDLSSWNTSSVINMNGMFFTAGLNAEAFSLDLSGWDTSSVTNMGNMFYDAGWLTSNTWTISGLSGWDTSSVTDMHNMFRSAGSSVSTLSLDLSNWNTSSVTDMQYMFCSAGYSATTWSVGNLSGWDTSNVTDMSYMFYNAGYSATTWSVGNLSSWDTSSVTDMQYMFYNAGYSVSTFSLNLSGWDASSVTNMQYMFYYAGLNAKAFSLDLSGWNTSSVTTMYYMFYFAGRSADTFSLDLSGWDTSSVTNMGAMFAANAIEATIWTLTIPQTNGNGISNTTSRMYGKTTSTYTTPDSGRSFTLAQ